jgi:cytochrome oxidase assembly protein ShyY1
LWVRWTALIIFVLILGTTFVFLGRWQLSRLHQRRAHNTAIRTNEKAPVASFGAVFDRPITHAQEYRRVNVTGTFDASKQVVIRYRSNGGADGYEVVAPLHTSHGHWLLVDRGFIASQKGTIPDSVPAPPSGRVSVTGRARISESGDNDATVPVHGHARLVNSGKIGTWIGHPVADGYLDTTSMHPADSTKFQRIKLPELSDGPHFWYAVQWFMFAGIGATGVVVFIRGDLRDRRANRQQGQTDHQPDRQNQKPKAPASSPSAEGAARKTDEKPPGSHKPAGGSGRRPGRASPQRPVRYGDTQAPPGWEPPTRGK